MKIVLEFRIFIEQGFNQKILRDVLQAERRMMPNGNRIIQHKAWKRVELSKGEVYVKAAYSPCSMS